MGCDQTGTQEVALVNFLDLAAENAHAFPAKAETFAKGYGLSLDESAAIWLPANNMDELFELGNEPDWRVEIAFDSFGDEPDPKQYVSLETFRFFVSATLLWCKARTRSSIDPWSLIARIERTCTIEGQTALLPPEVRQHLGLP